MAFAQRNLAAHCQGAVTVVMDVQASPDRDSEDARWRQWKLKGRDDDARFRRRLRAVLFDVAGVVAIAAAFWFSF